MKLNEKPSISEVEKLVNTFDQLRGWRLYRELLKWVLTGVFMGTSDAIPGYSGGTTLALLGFFKRLIIIAKSVFVPEQGLTRIKALIFMIPFSMGWLIGVFGFAKLTEYLASHHMGLELIFFFSAFITFAIPVFLRSENPRLFKKTKHITRRWTFFIIGLLFVVGLALSIFFFTSGAPFHGLEKSGIEHLSLKDHWWRLILVAFGAGAITIVPGGSGAIIQLLANYYDKIHWIILGHPLNNLGGMMIFAFSTLGGMLFMVFTFSYVLKKWDTELAAFSFGMLLASIGCIFIIPEREIWGELHSISHIRGVVVAWALGATFAMSIEIYIKRKRRHEKIHT